MGRGAVLQHQTSRETEGIIFRFTWTSGVAASPGCQQHSLAAFTSREVLAEEREQPLPRLVDSRLVVIALSQLAPPRLALLRCVHEGVADGWVRVHLVLHARRLQLGLQRVHVRRAAEAGHCVLAAVVALQGHLQVDGVGQLQAVRWVIDAIDALMSVISDCVASTRGSKRRCRHNTVASWTHLRTWSAVEWHSSIKQLRASTHGSSDGQSATHAEASHADLLAALLPQECRRPGNVSHGAGPLEIRHQVVCLLGFKPDLAAVEIGY